jgi:hypothetical protein
VKDALVREGVPATAISVIGRGEQGLLVETGDGVREPQNRRVEIVVQYAWRASETTTGGAPCGAPLFLDRAQGARATATTSS